MGISSLDLFGQVAPVNRAFVLSHEVLIALGERPTAVETCVSRERGRVNSFDDTVLGLKYTKFCDVIRETPAYEGTKSPDSDQTPMTLQMHFLFYFCILARSAGLLFWFWLWMSKHSKYTDLQTWNFLQIHVVALDAHVLDMFKLVKNSSLLLSYFQILKSIEIRNVDKYSLLSISRTRITLILRYSKRLSESIIHFDCFLHP